ncbi:MAG: TSUP family transporter [Alphaproteobacteria bacterium]
MEDILVNSYFQILFILFIAAFVAGTVDAIAGGGGLITVPVLLMVGMPPLTALGTNRLQASIGELTAFMTFWRKNQVQVKGLAIGAIFTGVGAVLGSYAVNLISSDFLKVLLPILMVIIAVYSLFSARLKSSKAEKPKLSTRNFMIIFGLLLGFYNGFFGPATGTLWMISFVVFLGLSLRSATIATKPLNLISNVISLIFFIGVGHINLVAGAVMGFGQILGASIGSRLVISNGDKIVRPVFITVTLIMTFKLIFDVIQDGSLERFLS